jgi:hypothetical protein
MNWRTAHNRRRSRDARWWRTIPKCVWLRSSTGPMTCRAGDVVQVSYSLDGYSATIVREGEPDEVHALSPFTPRTPGCWEWDGAGEVSAALHQEGIAT